MRQTFPELVIHTPHATVALRAAVDLLDLRLPHALRAAATTRTTPCSRPQRWTGAAGDDRSHRPRRPQRAADRRRPRLAAHARPLALSAARTRRSRAAWRCTPTATARTSRSGSTAATCPPATAGASRRATRCASAWARSTRASTSRTPTVRAGRGPRARRRPLPGQLDPAPASRRRRRTASSSSATRRAIACRSPPRASAPPSTSASPAGASCARWSRAARRAPRRCGATPTFSAAHRWKFAAMLRVQRLIPRVPPRVLGPAIRAMSSKRFVDWSFTHYLQIAPPSFAAAGPAPRSAGERRAGGGVGRWAFTACNEGRPRRGLEARRACGFPDIQRESARQLYRLGPP